MLLLMEHNYAVLIKKHQSLKGVSIFSYFYWLFIDLISSTIKKFTLCVALVVATRKVFEIKEFADTLLFLIYQ